MKTRSSRKQSRRVGAPIFSFFDVRATRGDDYFLTITESRKTVDAEGRTTYDRHKIFLYKEDFDKFVHGLSETLDYIRSHRPMPEPELQE